MFSFDEDETRLIACHNDNVYTILGYIILPSFAWFSISYHIICLMQRISRLVNHASL